MGYDWMPRHKLQRQNCGVIVANEQGFSERNIHAAVQGEGFFLIIVFGHEIDQLNPGEWSQLYDRWRARLYLGGRLIIADSSEGIGIMPVGARQHSWTLPEKA